MALDYQGIYILSSGMLLQQRALDNITNNLANVNTNGFKRDLLLASSWVTPYNQERTQSPEDPANNFIYPIVERVYTDVSQGAIRQTGNPLDLAIEGQGYFVLSNGTNTFYTRDGNFRIDNQGYLVNHMGMRVLMEGDQPIRVEGELKVSHDGTVFVNNEQIGRLAIVNLENIQKQGNNLFTGVAVQAQGYRILQGALESSNVNAIVEMVKLIQTHRAHEVYSNLVRTLDDLQSKANNIGR